ncbi:hypothetical protein P8864_11460 [Priestia flexa]|uniref:hypothetical protein n=1 Tax=Priestia flexa TaxID=86664 RepID=UPI002DB682AF|nr:hypothetical protein [Priestia flexa]MEC0666504.1 hypothetical protein [Priestia flexa]
MEAIILLCPKLIFYGQPSIIQIILRILQKEMGQLKIFKEAKIFFGSMIVLSWLIVPFLV